MKLYRKLLILIIIIISTALIWRLAEKRQSMSEGFYNPFATTADNEIKTVTSTVVVGVKNAFNPNLPLMQYCIKASYNSAYSGSTVNTNMIAYVLTRGCRFLDFQLTYVLDSNQTPRVYVSTTYNKSTMLLGDAFTEIVKSAFNAPSPNATDPLFIQFRINSKNNDIYNMIGVNIKALLSSMLYSTKIDVEHTTLSDIGSKIVLIMDTTTTYNYTDSTYYPNPANNLNNFIMMESGSSQLQTYTYSGLSLLAASQPTTDDQITASVKAPMKLVKPNAESNPHISIITTYGCQIIACQFYINDTSLTSYESLFANNSAAFIPMGMAIQYINYNK